MPNFKTFAAAPAMLAALSLTVTPAAAADMALPVAAPSAIDTAPVVDVTEAQTAEHHRYRRYHRHRYHHRRGPSAGDVLTGVLIIGAVAAVANAAKRDDRRDRDYRERDYRDREYRDRDYRERDYRRDARNGDTRGIDRAVSMCVDAVDEERRVETVDRVDRTASGWQVEGTITRGDPFLCRIDENGRDVEVDFPPRSARYDRSEAGENDYQDVAYPRSADDRQHDDERYASEWSKVDSGETVVTAQSAQPAYPGGPIEGDAAIDADLEVGDGYKGA